MGEYEPEDSRNVTGTASTPDGRWTGQAANDPTMTDAQRQAQQGSPQGQAEPFTEQQAAQSGREQSGQQQAGQEQAGQQQADQLGQQSAPQQNMGGSQGQIGQANDGVSDAGNQNNDHTSAIGQNQAAGAAGSGQASYGNSGQGMSQASGQPQQFQDSTGQQVGGSQQGAVGQGGQFADQLAKHQEVVDANGHHLGTIDHVDGDRIKLTRQDSPDGEHHYVSLRDVQGIEGGRVRLSTSNGAMGGGATSGSATGSGTQA